MRKCGQWTESAMAPSVLSIQVVSLWLSSARFDHICTFELCFFLGSFEIFFVDFPLTFFCTCDPIIIWQRVPGSTRMASVYSKAAIAEECK